MLIRNLVTNVNPCNINSVNVTWDLQTSGDQLEKKEVAKIHKVEFDFFGRKYIDVTDHFFGNDTKDLLRECLEKALLDEVQFQNIKELSNHL